MNETIGMRIRGLRRGMGFTQEEVADRLMTKKATISAYENDRIDIKVSILKELAEILHTSIAYLAEGKISQIDSDVLQIAVLLNGIEEENIRAAALNVTMIMLALEKDKKTYKKDEDIFC